MIRSRGITEAEARRDQGCGGIVLGLVLGAGAWLGTQFIPLGIRMDTTLGFTISTALALVVWGAVFLVFRSLYQAQEKVTYLGELGLARATARQGRAELVALAPFARVVDVKLSMGRRGKNGRILVKTWSFVSADGRPLIALSGEGDMDPWSADPAKATTRYGGWEFAEAAIAQWQVVRPR